MKHSGILMGAMLMEKGKTEFTDGIVIIRPHRPGDVMQLYEAVRESIPALTPRMSWCHVDYSIEEARKWIETSHRFWNLDMEYHFAIIHVADGSFLGGCGLNQVDLVSSFTNLGYWVRSTRTGEGIATAAAVLAVSFAFNILGLSRVSVVAASDNFASQRVAEKIGAVREGIVKGRCLVHNIAHDAVTYSLTISGLKSRIEYQFR